jgi:hypothetical protein
VVYVHGVNSTVPRAAAQAAQFQHFATRRVVVVADAITNVDLTALDALISLYQELQQQGIELHFAGLKGVVRDRLLAPSSALIATYNEGRSNRQVWNEVAVLSALHHRDASGEGQHLDISLFSAVLAISSGQLSNYMVGGKIPVRTGNHAPNITPYGVYPCSDGQLIVASANQGQFNSMCKALGHPEWATDDRFKDNPSRIAHRHELHGLFSDIMCQQTRAHWESVFTEAGVPAGPINDYSQALAHPQAAHLGSRIGIAHPLGGEAPGIASPMRLSKTPVSYRRPPPMLGEHTREVLRELGLDQAAIDALTQSGTISST